MRLKANCLQAFDLGAEQRRRRRAGTHVSCFQVLGVLATLWVCALASPADPKVAKLVAANEEEAAAALVEEPRDKRNWVHYNKAGFIDAVVESDVDPAVVATAVAAASDNAFAGSFQSPSAVSGRTRWSQPSFGNYGYGYNYPYWWPQSAQWRTRGSGFPSQNQFDNYEAWLMWRNFNNNAGGFVPYQFMQRPGSNVGQNLPDVIDTSPQGRTRMVTDSSGRSYAVAALNDLPPNFNPNVRF